MCKNIVYFPHRGCICTLRTLYVYATALLLVADSVTEFQVVDAAWGKILMSNFFVNFFKNVQT